MHNSLSLSLGPIIHGKYCAVLCVLTYFVCRWEDYTALGEPMKSDKVSTRFISFKVPLKQVCNKSCVHINNW